MVNEVFMGEDMLQVEMRCCMGRTPLSNMHPFPVQLLFSDYAS